MRKDGHYGDDRTFALPDGWPQASAKVLETAADQALSALTGELAIAGLGRYYDRDGSFAGTMFLDATPNDPFSMQAADLYAVTTLSMDLDARHGRLLLDEGKVRDSVRRQLRGLDPHLPLTDLQQGDGGSAETLVRMFELYSTFRSLLSERSCQWVTAAKLCARKRPRLFPVRDTRIGYRHYLALASREPTSSDSRCFLPPPVGVAEFVTGFTRSSNERHSVVGADSGSRL